MAIVRILFAHRQKNLLSNDRFITNNWLMACTDSFGAHEFTGPGAGFQHMIDMIRKRACKTAEKLLWIYEFYCLRNIDYIYRIYIYIYYIFQFSIFRLIIFDFTIIYFEKILKS